MYCYDTNSQEHKENIGELLPINDHDPELVMEMDQEDMNAWNDYLDDCDYLPI